MRRLLLLVPALAGPVMAQPPAPRALCYRAAPRPSCRSFLVTEFGGSLLLASNQLDRRLTLFQYSLGAVKNLSPSVGVGGAVFGTWSEGAIMVGIGPRFRYWATPRVSVDLAPGLIVFQGGSRNLGFNAQVAANYGPHVALTTTLQMSNESYRHFSRVEWFAGARLDGKVGTIAGIATPILVFLGYLFLYRYSD